MGVVLVIDDFQAASILLESKREVLGSDKSSPQNVWRN
jgi:hypothetical protein